MRRISWRGWVLSVLVGGSLVACSTVQPGPNDEVQSELNRQIRRWRAQSIDDYTYTVQRHCFCTEDFRAPVRVQVRDGAVQSRTYPDGRALASAEQGQFWPAVEGLFGVVQDAIDRDAATIEVKYHPELGYPTSIQVDYDQMMADEELGITAGDLTRQ